MMGDYPFQKMKDEIIKHRKEDDEEKENERQKRW